MDKIPNNKFAKKYIKVFETKILPFYLIDDHDYFTDILNDKSKSFTKYYDKYKILEEANPNKGLDLLIFALSNKKKINFTKEEKEEILEKYGRENEEEFFLILDDIKKNYNKKLDDYSKVGEKILEIESEIASLEKFDYNIVNISYDEEYELSIKGKLLTEDDALTIFNKVETSPDIPVIVFTNNKGKKFTRINKKAKFDYEKMLNDKFPENSVAFYVENQVIVVDASKSYCSISVEINNKNINWNNNIQSFKSLLNFVTFKEKSKQNKIVGEITFSIHNQLNSEDFYSAIMLDPLLSFFLYFEEKSKPWAFDKENYIVHFRDYNESMVYLNNYAANMAEFNTLTK